VEEIATETRKSTKSEDSTARKTPTAFEHSEVSKKERGARTDGGSRLLQGVQEGQNLEERWLHSQSHFELNFRFLQDKPHEQSIKHMEDAYMSKSPSFSPNTHPEVAIKSTSPILLTTSIIALKKRECRTLLLKVILEVSI